MSEENKAQKRDILAASEANVNFLSNVLDPLDFKQFVALKEEIKDTWHKKQVFRTETEMRMSVLQDAKYPTKASKYWQCVREQNVFFENLMSLSFDYRKNEVKIIRLKKKLAEETDPLRVEMLEINIEHWSRLKKEYNDGTFDDKNVNTHQAESYKYILTNKVKTLTPGSSQPEVFNVVGQLQTLERLEKEGVLLTAPESKKQLAKSNQQNNEMKIVTRLEEGVKNG